MKWLKIGPRRRVSTAGCNTRYRVDRPVVATGHVDDDRQPFNVSSANVNRTEGHYCWCRTRYNRERFMQLYNYRTVIRTRWRASHRHRPSARRWIITPSPGTLTCYQFVKAMLNSCTLSIYRSEGVSPSSATAVATTFCDRTETMNLH